MQEKTSNYSVTRWEEDFKHKENIMRNMCEYPLVFNGNLSYDQQLQQQARGNTSYGNLDYQSEKPLLQGGLPRIGTSAGGQRNINKSFTTGGVNESMLGGKGMGKPIIRQAESLDENRIVLYKKGKQLGAGYYIVEISSNNSYLFIAAYDVESPESFLIELPEKKA